MSAPRGREVRAGGEVWSVRELTVSRGDARWAMAYWFQNRRRVEANEFSARWNLFTDALRRRPADTAMVRVMTPVMPGDAAGYDAVAAFSGELIPHVRRALTTAR